MNITELSAYPKPKRSKKEESVQMALCRFLDVKYPGLYYYCDISGMYLNVGQRVRIAKMRSKDFKIIDLAIFEPRGAYRGLILEIKQNRDEVYCKNGELRTDKHTQVQWQSIQHLQSKGYHAQFACGIDECHKVVEWYMGLKTVNN